jgi:hypothetical protein
MKSDEPATRPAEGKRRPSHVVDAPRGLGNSLPHSDPTRVFLHQMSQTLTSLRGTLELALLVDSDAQDYRRAIQQSLAQAEALVQLFKSYRVLIEEGDKGRRE